MNDLSLINFQIFPSKYEQNGDGEKCCWMGGRPSSDKTAITLQPYQTGAIKGYTNPEWAFHLLATNTPDEYRLKYVKMNEPLQEWYGISIDGDTLVLEKYKEDVDFKVKKIGEYFTLEYKSKHVECSNGKLSKSTAIQLWDNDPPTAQQVAVYNDIPEDKFRVLWKFVEMNHISGPNWITLLSNTARSSETIDRLFIPGTHDSGTEKNSQWYQTQFHTIPEQVAMGIRYLDLRVAQNWEIYHEKSYSDISLQYVVDAVLDHLENYPDEFFFIQITPEVANGFSSLLYTYLETNCPKVFNHIYMSSDIPTLTLAKGKIFFFARMYTPVNHNQKYPFKEHPIDWPDNTPGSLATKIPFVSPQVYVQDRYSNEGNSSKFDNYIKPTLYNKMFSGKDADWVINYTSVSNSNYPIHSAENINPWVADLLLWTKPKPSGVVMIDDARVGNVANIIALNFD